MQRLLPFFSGLSLMQQNHVFNTISQTMSLTCQKLSGISHFLPHLPSQMPSFSDDFKWPWALLSICACFSLCLRSLLWRSCGSWVCWDELLQPCKWGVSQRSTGDSEAGAALKSSPSLSDNPESYTQGALSMICPAVRSAGLSPFPPVVRFI